MHKLLFSDRTPELLCFVSCSVPPIPTPQLAALHDALLGVCVGLVCGVNVAHNVLTILQIQQIRRREIREVGSLDVSCWSLVV